VSCSNYYGLIFMNTE